MRLAGLHHTIFDHFLFLLAAEEMCRHEMLWRLVLVVENSILQDDDEVHWIAIPYNKIGLCNVWKPLRFNDGPSGGASFYTHFPNPYIGEDLSITLWKSFLQSNNPPHFKLSSPQKMAFILTGYPLNSAFSQQWARSDIALSNTAYSFSLISFGERFFWSHDGLLSPSNFGLKTTLANEFDKRD